MCCVFRTLTTDDQRCGENIAIFLIHKYYQGLPVVKAEKDSPWEIMKWWWSGVGGEVGGEELKVKEKRKLTIINKKNIS